MKKLRTFKKKANRDIRVCKRHFAKSAIGKIEKNSDVFILTAGQFSLIDAMVEIIDQTGPADVVISSWTAASANLIATAEMIESSNIKSFRMIIDRSFHTRQPDYYYKMVELFGVESIREINTHAKFMVIINDSWNIVIRTSMNLNENPRLENIEISESKPFADFFIDVTRSIFDDVGVKERTHIVPKLKEFKEHGEFNLIKSNKMQIASLKVPEATHEIK